MTVLDITQAIELPAALRNPNHIAYLSNSRGAQQKVSVRRTSPFNFFNQGNARMGRRMTLIYNPSVSGWTSTQFLDPALVANVINSDAKYVIVGPPVNDFAAYGIIEDTFTVRYKPTLDLFLKNGVIPIIETEQGQLTKTTPDYWGAVQRFAQKLKAYQQAVAAAAVGEVLIQDTANACVDPAATVATPLFRGPSDKTHCTIYPAVLGGRAFAAMMSPRVPAVPIRTVSAMETRAVGYQGFINPGFRVLSTGVAPGSGFTYAAFATMPLGITSAVCDTGITCTFTTETDPVTNIVWWVFTITATQAGNARVSLDFSTGFENDLDFLTGYARARVMAGSVNLRTPFLDIQDNRGGVNNLWSDMYSDNGLIFAGSDAPSGVDQGVMPGDLTEDLTYRIDMQVGSGTRTAFTPRFYMPFAGAGSATIKWAGDFAIDKLAA